MPLETQSQSRAFFAPNKARFSHQTKRVFRTKQSAFFAPNKARFSHQKVKAERPSSVGETTPPKQDLSRSHRCSNLTNQIGSQAEGPSRWTLPQTSLPVPRQNPSPSLCAESLPLCRITASWPTQEPGRSGQSPKRPVTEAASHRSGQSRDGGQDQVAKASAPTNRQRRQPDLSCNGPSVRLSRLRNPSYVKIPLRQNSGGTRIQKEHSLGRPSTCTPCYRNKDRSTAANSDP
jgi:hypothetical protein